MNTGIGDAINLAWKLAAVLRRRADATLLASYEPERIAFARRLVNTWRRARPAGCEGAIACRGFPRMAPAKGTTSRRSRRSTGRCTSTERPPQSSRRRGLPLHVLPWSPRADEAGLARDAAYLVRPDGYVGIADPAASAATLERYADERGLKFGTR